MRTRSSPVVAFLVNLNTGRLNWNPGGLHIHSVQTIELLLLLFVAYLIAAAQLTTEGDPLMRLENAIFCPLRLDKRCENTRPSRWETSGAWLTTEGAPVDAVVDRVTTSSAAGGCSCDAVGDRVTPNTAARRCSCGRGGRPRDSKHGCQEVLQWTLWGSVDLPAFVGRVDAHANQHLLQLRVANAARYSNRIKENR